MTLSLRFRASDNGSTIIITWCEGELIKRYNGRKPYRSLLTEAPQSVAAFEQICRQRFLLGQKWQAVTLIGDRS